MLVLVLLAACDVGSSPEQKISVEPAQTTVEHAGVNDSAWKQTRRLARSRRALAYAKQKLEKGEFPVALSSAQMGLLNVKADYALPDAIDDTGQKLRAAQDAEREGRVEDAARIWVTVLESRVGMLAGKLGPDVK